ncbi:MAG: DEAD/DEAH box helicase [Planctomycetia bacterium]|nr:DEAD/DEAH box helicase [Planctomycetia bacterium]
MKAIHDSLAQFHPTVAQWFHEQVGVPTQPQILGWPSIASGQNTLILAPTGSGKTLAAFLACLDQLWKQENPQPGVQLLYISPLKALNNDVFRNLHVPLQGVKQYAQLRGDKLAEITVGLRTGDTSTSERQKQLRKPPHVLITTPESLHLLLTSQGHAILKSVKWCIVDEIHVLCPNKRGVFLSILLERLQEVIGSKEMIRIGLSATQRPLEKVASFLGGYRILETAGYEPRPVNIVDAGQRKRLDLQVVSPVDTFGPLPEKTIWPSIYRYLYDQIIQHRSTLIFANNRRAVERITGAINELHEERTVPAAGESIPQLARAHHGSVSLEMRRQTEQQLKEGKLACVVSTASLELGIDMGSIDLVCQVESSGNIARSLQRVGRAGHLVGSHSKGRLIPKSLPDLLEQTALANAMIHGEVEHLQVPGGCLDIVAQQVIAMVAMKSWSVPELYAFFRKAYPLHELTPEAFESVLEMISGRFPADTFQELKARITWDRIHNRLHALPGSKQLALVNGGTIPDTGQYAVYITGTTNRIGELDEEFVFERRINDVFTLGTSNWRIDSIESDRVTVSRAEGTASVMPFWRGEKISRSYELGVEIGNLLQQMQVRMANDLKEAQAWLQDTYHLELNAANNLTRFLKRQIEVAGVIPGHGTILCEAFRDQIGDWHLVILSSLGSRFHLTLRFALEAIWQKEFGYQPHCLHHDDGLLIRLSDHENPPLDILQKLDAAKVKDQVLQSLSNSALFAIRFRHNAARALMLPVSSPQKRAPLWLQRLKSKNLLQIARAYPRFPIVLETYRECLHDHLVIDQFVSVLESIQSGKLNVVTRRAETPSPFASQLLFSFTAAYLYEWDHVERQGTNTASPLDTSVLDQLLTPENYQHLLDPQAITQVNKRLQGTGLLPRTQEEFAEWLRKLGDLQDEEIPPECTPFLSELEAQSRIVRLKIADHKDSCWVLAEYLESYHAVNQLIARDNVDEAVIQQALTVVHRFIRSHALVGIDDILSRYPLPRQLLEDRMQLWSSEGKLIAIEEPEGLPGLLFSAPQNLEQVERSSISIRRREIPTVSGEIFAQFLLNWQGRAIDHQQAGPDGLKACLHRLMGLTLPRELWERVIFPSRVTGYQTRWLDDLIMSGEWCWIAQPLHDEDDSSRCQMIRFIKRDDLQYYRSPTDESALVTDESAVHHALQSRGAMFLTDLSQHLQQQPSQIRQALWALAERGLVTNDRFNVLRNIEQVLNPDLNQHRRASLRALRSQRAPLQEGRWSLVPWGTAETESCAIFQVQQLLERYGIISRDLALLDETLLPWRVLYEILSRLELTGEVRRGYFVHELAGAQFGLPSAIEQLMKLNQMQGKSEMTLLHAFDPANLYGPSLPLGWPFSKSENESVNIPWSRRKNNWLIQQAGKIILAIESQGRKLWPAPSATAKELMEAIQLLPEIVRSVHGVDLRAKLMVDEWNGTPVQQSPARELLESAGFVNDYPAMSWYAAWA